MDGREGGWWEVVGCDLSLFFLSFTVLLPSFSLSLPFLYPFLSSLSVFFFQSLVASFAG